MKSFVIALAATAIAMPAFAQSTGSVLPEYGTFSSRGKCESALAHVRNDQRRNVETRGAGYEGLTGSEFNRASKATTRCEEVGGKYVFVYSKDGFDD